MEFRHELVFPNEDLPFRMFLFEGQEGNYQVGKHWHHSVEIFLVLDGQIDFYINSWQHRLQKQDYVIVNSNEIHSINCPDPNKTIVLQIPVQNFASYINEEPYIDFLKKDYAQNDQICPLITCMFEVYEQRSYGYEFKVKSLFYQLLYVLMTEFKAQTIQKEVIRQKWHLDRLSKVTQYMKEHYQEQLTLETVASQFGFTPTYLSRIFKKYAKVNYRTYLADLRVTYAARELLNTNHSIGEVALEHGFPDSRAFTRVFAKRYGCLPSQYRKQIQKEKK